MNPLPDNIFEKHIFSKKISILDINKLQAKSEPDYFKALDIDILIDKAIEPKTVFGRDVIKKVLQNPCVNIDEIMFRQSILKNLVERENSKEVILNAFTLVSKLDEFCKLFENVESKKERFPVQNIINKITRCVDSIKSLHSFLILMKAEGMVELRQLLEGIRNLKKYTELLTFKDSLMDAEGFQLAFDHSKNNILLQGPVRKVQGKKLKIVCKGEYGKAPVDKINMAVAEILEEEALKLIGDFPVKARKICSVLDCYASVANFFRSMRDDYNCPLCLPKLEKTNNYMCEIKNAIHPLLVNKNPVLNDFSSSFDKEYNIISGENNGGKTIYLKTKGLMQLFAQVGWYLPCQKAKLSIADQILTNIGITDDIEKGAGSYYNKTKHVERLLSMSSPRSLVLLDEPEKGAYEQKGLREKTGIYIKGLQKSPWIAYVATHLHKLSKITSILQLKL